MSPVRPLLTAIGWRDAIDDVPLVDGDRLRIQWAPGIVGVEVIGVRVERFTVRGIPREDHRAFVRRESGASELRFLSREQGVVAERVAGLVSLTLQGAA